MLFQLFSVCPVAGPALLRRGRIGTDVCVEPGNLPAVFKAAFSSITCVAYTDYSEPVHLLICSLILRCWKGHMLKA